MQIYLDQAENRKEKAQKIREGLHLANEYITKVKKKMKK